MLHCEPPGLCEPTQWNFWLQKFRILEFFVFFDQDPALDFDAGPDTDFRSNQ